MPFYEYECSACKFYVEALQKISDAPMRKCPSCKKQTLKKLVSAPVFRLKGGGWYETDFKSDKEDKRNLVGADEAPPEPKADEAKKEVAAKDAPEKDAAAKKPADTKAEVKPGKSKGGRSASKPAPKASKPKPRARPAVKKKKSSRR